MPNVTINGTQFEAPVCITGAWIKEQVGAPPAHQAERAEEGTFYIIESGDDYTALEGDHFIVAPRPGYSN